jgi:hypothetical protein
MFKGLTVTPHWLIYYNLFIIVIVPSILNGLFNFLIFLKVRASSRRVHSETRVSSIVGHPHHQYKRDIHLLKHMLFIFVMYIIGWV